MSFILIETLQDLKYLNKELLLKSHVGIDTEFKRSTKENITLSLIQINDGEETYLIDCLSIGKCTTDISFLFSDDVKKIFHSCREDFDAIFSWTNQWPNNIFDTQLANAFLGGKYSIGYKELVFSKLGVSIDKEETRSNWTKRPLRDSQLSYAASDVQFLIELFEKQTRDLNLTKKMDWVIEQQLINEKTYLSVAQNEIKGPLSKMSKELEKDCLRILHKDINFLAKKYDVNPTLLFSKKNQRGFLSRFFSCGLEGALKPLSSWKKEILSKNLEALAVKLTK